MLRPLGYREPDWLRVQEAQAESQGITAELSNQWKMGSVVSLSPGVGETSWQDSGHRSGLTLLWSQSSSSCRVKPDQSRPAAAVWCSSQELQTPTQTRTLPGLWSGPLTSHEWMSGLVGVLLEGDVSPWQLASPSNTTEWSCKDSGFFSLLPHLHSDLVWLRPAWIPLVSCFYFIFLMWIMCPCSCSLLYFLLHGNIFIHANSSYI